MDDYMGNKSLIPNSTQIPNIISDFVEPQIPDGEARCLRYICRRTFGFHKKEDRISLSQFTEGITTKDGKKLDYGAGVSRPTAIKALNNLEAAGAIFRIRDSKGNFYKVNLEMDAEKVVKQLYQSSSFTKSGKATLPKVVKLLNPQKKGNKEKQSSMFAPSAHQQFIDFFYDTCQKTRGLKPKITGADGMNLKRILETGLIRQIELQQLALYFLANRYFKKFSPSVSTFLSSGIINGLMNDARNREDFWKELDGYTQLFLKQPVIKENDFGDRLASLAAMREKLIQSKAFGNAISR